MTPAAARSDIVKASGWMAGTLLSFIGLAIGGRELSAELGTFEILFFRSLVGLVVIGVFVWRTGWKQLKTSRPELHLWRNLAHYVGQYGWFYGLAFIPLADVFAIEFTVPIWTAVFATIWLEERLTRGRVLAVALGILGLLIILRPGLMALNPAALAVLIAAFGYALSHTLTKKLAHIDTPLTILFYMTVIQLPLGLIPSLATWVRPSPAMWPWLLVVGLTALSAHYCMARAFTLADATIVVPMDFLRLPLIALVGVIFYSEPFDWLVILGGGVMLMGNLINIRSEQNRLQNSRKV